MYPNFKNPSKTGPGKNTLTDLVGIASPAPPWLPPASPGPPPVPASPDCAPPLAAARRFE